MSEYSRRLNFKGFTLIELLVVISIIALLMSIMMPGLQKAREMAKKIVCSSNTRSCHMVINLYVNDFADCMPFNSWDSSNPSYSPTGYNLYSSKSYTRAYNTWHLLDNYVLAGKTKSGVLAGSIFREFPSPWFCETLDKLAVMQKSTGVMVRNVYSYEKYYETFEWTLLTNYCMNGRWGVTHKDSRGYISSPLRVSNIKASQDKIIIMDGNYWNYVSTEDHLDEWNDGGDGRVHYPHGKKAVVLFFDGHVESKRRDGLSYNRNLKIF